MDINITRHPAPTQREDIQQALLEMTPPVVMRWNSRWKETPQGWEGRWEIWIKLEMNSHPDLKPEIAETDLWLPGRGWWVRKLQAYTEEDGSFAPMDERLIWGLEMADTWGDRRFYEDRVEAPHHQQEEAKLDPAREAFTGATRYHDDYDRTLVGPAGSGDWRWRIR